MADYLDHLNEKYGQGGSNTTSVQNNASSQGDYLNHLKQKYGGNTPTTQFLVDEETKIPSMGNLSTNAINSSESPNSSVLSLSDADIISKYESIPDYNVLSRWVDKDKSNAYKQKQEMYGDYKDAKTREVGKLIEEMGITEDDLNLSKGQAMGVSINPVGLNKYNLTDEQKRDISEYAQDYFNQKRSASVTEFADKHPVLSTGLSFVSNPVESAVDTLQTGIDYVSGNPVSKKTTDVTQNIRDTVSEDMGTVGKTVYGIGTSIGDMLVAAATGHPGAIMGLEKHQAQ